MQDQPVVDGEEVAEDSVVRGVVGAAGGEEGGGGGEKSKTKK